MEGEERGEALVNRGEGCCGRGVVAGGSVTGLLNPTRQCHCRLFWGAAGDLLLGGGGDFAGEAGFLEFVEEGFAGEVAGEGHRLGAGFYSFAGDAGDFVGDGVDGCDAFAAAEVDAGDLEGFDVAVGGTGGGIYFDGVVGGFAEEAAGGEGINGFLCGGLVWSGDGDGLVNGADVALDTGDGFEDGSAR